MNTITTTKDTKSPKDIISILRALRVLRGVFKNSLFTCCELYLENPEYMENKRPWI
jgi:hypothetical protein